MPSHLQSTTSVGSGWTGNLLRSRWKSDKYKIQWNKKGIRVEILLTIFSYSGKCEKNTPRQGMLLFGLLTFAGLLSVTVKVTCWMDTSNRE